MGTYVNPGNEGFATVLNDEYVDKSGMIELVNSVVDTPRKLVCVSRPRRFGKSYAAKMLAAYYDRSCDSSALFDGLGISRSAGYRDHLNRYNVVLVDLTDVMGRMAKGQSVADELQRVLVDDLRREFPQVDAAQSLGDSLMAVVEATGSKFVFVIDEWDAPFREPGLTEDFRRDYVMFLRGLFKSANRTDKIVAAAYMTGILPIKKYGTQSAVSDFYEYTMVNPGPFARYVGFTEDEVRGLCAAHGMDFTQMKRWYDGYSFPGAESVYGPNSVMRALHAGRFDTYWASSETYVSLRGYIEMDFDGLQQVVVRLLAGDAVPVNARTFQNDMTSIESCDDVLTLLVHLGYLAYSWEDRTVRVPNEEVRLEFKDAVESGAHPRLASLVAASRKLLADTVAADEAAVALGIERVHDANCSPLFYNNEQALRSVVKMAYIAAIDHYARIEELPSGRGYADVVYVPRAGSPYPALVVELKWNETCAAAIEQVKARRYPAVFEGYAGEVLLVGVAYDAKSGRHTCKIERVERA